MVVYNISKGELRPILAELSQQLDAQAVWAEDSLALPQLEVRLHLESFPAMRNVSLLAVGHQQNPAGWRHLEHALAARLDATRVIRNVRGLSFVSCGLLLLAAIFYFALKNPQAIAQGLWEMLRF